MARLLLAHPNLMSYALTLSCLVLASYDVGEADRFLVLLTRERGRLAARVPGARRMQSRLKNLLPLTVARVEAKETKTGFLVTGIAGSSPGGKRTVGEFLLGTQVTELLLALLADGEPVPEIFDATTDVLSRCRKEPQLLPAFAFRLLRLLGVLPDAEHASQVAHLSPEERAFIARSAEGQSETGQRPTKRLTALCERLILEHATRPLKAPAVASACMN